MEKKATNIYPIFDRMMSRDDKEQLLKQRGSDAMVHRTERFGKKHRCHRP